MWFVLIPILVNYRFIIIIVVVILLCLKVYRLYYINIRFNVSIIWYLYIYSCICNMFKYIPTSSNNKVYYVQCDTQHWNIFLKAFLLNSIVVNLHLRMAFESILFFVPTTNYAFLTVLISTKPVTCSNLSIERYNYFPGLVVRSFIFYTLFWF